MCCILGAWYKQLWFAVGLLFGSISLATVLIFSSPLFCRNSNVSGERSPFEGSCCSGQGVADNSDSDEIEEISKYRVVMLGDSGVGKTALVSQFMTSEYMNTYDASLGENLDHY